MNEKINKKFYKRLSKEIEKNPHYDSFRLGFTNLFEIVIQNPRIFYLFFNKTIECRDKARKKISVNYYKYLDKQRHIYNGKVIA